MIPKFEIPAKVLMDMVRLLRITSKDATRYHMTFVNLKATKGVLTMTARPTDEKSGVRE